MFRQSLLPLELGPVLVVAGAVGLVALLGRRATRGAALGWIAFGTLLLAPLAHYNFQPFRNVLPIVVALMVAAGCLVGDGSPLSRHTVASLALVGILLASLVPGLRTVIRDRARDSRVGLIDVLARPEWKGRRALVQRELAILPSELARAACDVEVAPWDTLPALSESGRFDLLVFGRFEDGTVPLPEWVSRANVFAARAAALQIVAVSGTLPIPVLPGLWRYNDEFVAVARLSPAGERAP